MELKIKSRVYALDKTLKALLDEMAKRGLSIDKSELTRANKGYKEARYDDIRTLANEIVTEWERGT